MWGKPHPKSERFKEKVLDQAVDIDESDLHEIAKEFGLQANDSYDDPTDVLLEDFVSDLEAAVKESAGGIIDNFGVMCPDCSSPVERQTEDEFHCRQCSEGFTLEDAEWGR